MVCLVLDFLEFLEFGNCVFSFRIFGIFAFFSIFGIFAFFGIFGIGKWCV